LRVSRFILTTGVIAILTAQLAIGGDRPAAARPVPTLDQALAARQDVWGLAAMAQTNGPSYAFFEKLLPPLRYVNAAFQHYPIVLSAPNAPQKARLASNGSGLNASGGMKTWKDIGTPVTFLVGEDDEIFGSDLRQLDGPHLARGFLPVVRFSYSHAGRVYEEEALASVQPALATNGVVFAGFAFRGRGQGRVTVRFDAPAPWTVKRDAVLNTNGEVVAWFDDSWRWIAASNSLVSDISRLRRSTLAFATRPAEASHRDEADTPRFVSPASCIAQRKDCITRWQALIEGGMRIDVPEPLVNDAWRALVVSLFALASDHHPNYSAGNSYERVYQAESGDIARALLLWNQTAECSRMIPALLDYTRDRLKFHNAGLKLQTLSHYYWLTRDKGYLESMRPRWEPAVKSIMEGREKDSGLFPREQYCGDIPTPVYSLHANAAAWRGLRDFSAVLADAGAGGRAAELLQSAGQLREAILVATAKSERRDVSPAFIPVALFGEEPAHDPLTGTMLGSYWDLMAPYMLGSGMFGPGSERETAIIDYLHEKGGICMGMIRFHQHSGLFANEDALDDLYGVRYTVKLLERDQVDRALVSFYGKLAQGLTLETFVGAEGTGLRPLDDFGRPMYLPPNGTAQAYFLWMLRYLLVQDWDLDDDGVPETLRLAFGTPKAWLEDGKAITVERAPTAFGLVSFVIESHLSSGEVTARLQLPERNVPRKTLLRVRVPDGWRVISAKSGKNPFAVDANGTVDLSKSSGMVILRFAVERR
jgi:hypothetical protein